MLKKLFKEDGFKVKCLLRNGKGKLDSESTPGMFADRTVSVLKVVIPERLYRVHGYKIVIDGRLTTLEWQPCEWPWPSASEGLLK